MVAPTRHSELTWFLYQAVNRCNTAVRDITPTLLHGGPLNEDGLTFEASIKWPFEEQQFPSLQCCLHFFRPQSYSVVKTKDKVGTHIFHGTPKCERISCFFLLIHKINCAIHTPSHQSQMDTSTVHPPACFIYLKLPELVFISLLVRWGTQKVLTSQDASFTSFNSQHVVSTGASK